VARVLKDELGNKVKVFLADPPGSVLTSYVQSGGKLKEREGGSITEGIGQGRVTDNLKGEIQLMDDAMTIPDTETIKMVYRLLDEEGLYMGASSALNVVAAVEMAKKLGKGSTVVTILCDAAYRSVNLFVFDLFMAEVKSPIIRYQTRLFSKKWLHSKALMDAVPDHLKKYAVLD